MKVLSVLVKRNVKLFFKDKGMFLTSLITPVILLVFYATFLGNVYRDSFLSTLPDGCMIPEKLMNGLVGGQLISSILAVSAVTVTFCSNFLMVQDKANQMVNDLLISPISSSVLSMGYYIANLISSLLICFAAAAICLVYVGVVGFYFSFDDVLLLFLDVLLVVLFGSALSSVINFFLSTQGQISAVGTVVSSGYGFICGAYMPISSFSAGLQKILSFLPGTYGTALVRTHALRGAFNELENMGASAEWIKELKTMLDCSVVVLNKEAPIWVMYAMVVGATLLLLGIYIFLNCKKRKI